MNHSIINLALILVLLVSISQSIKYITPQDGDIFDIGQIDKDGDRLVAYE